MVALSAMGGRSKVDLRVIGFPVAILGGSHRKIHEVINSEESEEASLRASQLIDPTLPRKTSSESP